MSTALYAPHLDGERIQSCYYVTMIIRKQQVVIVGGGTISTYALSGIREGDYIIGVDRGASWLIGQGIIPDVAIGDFDSVSPTELDEIRKKVGRVDEHPRGKDRTDSELALDHAIALNPKEVVIYGALGTRLDHTIANIHLLEKLCKKGFAGVIRNENNEVRLVDSRMIVKKDVRFRYVSILPVTDTIDVTLSGFVYDLSRVLICRGQTIGISNEIKRERATIEVHHGRAFVIQSRD
ncbi:thiamine diphosphokinase [Candidatus Gottesmanbacteria bacterium]|nr:thiamine diphosphokinase [Candidatus Gottesmanbacteria bacterium]